MSTAESAAASEGVFELLPFVLNPDNIARFESGKVLIGDRRAYPFSKTFVTCNSVADVAEAIRGMVTQGSGPWLSAVNALRIVTASNPPAGTALTGALNEARNLLVSTRPTNTAMRQRLDQTITAANKAAEAGDDVDAAIAASINTTLMSIYDDYALRARAMADLMEDGDGILTNCFAEAGFILALAFAKRDGKTLNVYVPETRPYFQGAKLTAPSIYELGIDVKLITDNMPAHMMSEGRIARYMTAADLITLDGHVVNKIGTFQNAIAARAFDIPYYAFAWGRDETKRQRADVVIEERDPAEIRQALGSHTTIEDIDARYPAFDITPPELVTGIVTVSGVVQPSELASLPVW